MHICQDLAFIRQFVVALEKASRRKKSVLEQQWVRETVGFIRHCEQCWRRYMSLAIPFLGPTFAWIDLRLASRDCLSEEALRAADDSRTVVENEHLHHCSMCLTSYVEKKNAKLCRTE